METRKSVLANMVAKNNDEVGIGTCIGSGTKYGYIYFVEPKDVKKFIDTWKKKGRKVESLVPNEYKAVVRKIFSECRKSFIDWDFWVSEMLGKDGEFISVSSKN